MDPFVIFIIVVVGILVLFALWYIGVSNRFKILGIKVDEAESGIDVALTKRFDVLTKMVEVVKGYAKHEKETLEKVIAMRQPANNASIKDKQEFDNKLTAAMGALNVVVERYPDLKANDNFKELQSTILEVEEHLQAARRLYNSNVSIFNQTIIVFPNSIVANMMKLDRREFYEVEEHKRKDVKIEF